MPRKSRFVPSELYQPCYVLVRPLISPLNVSLVLVRQLHVTIQIYNVR